MQLYPPQKGRFSSTVPTCENVFNLKFFLDIKKTLPKPQKLWQWTIPFFNRKHLRKGSIFYCYCSFTRAKKKKFVVDFSFFLLILLASFFGKILHPLVWPMFPRQFFFEQQIAGYIEMGQENCEPTKRTCGIEKANISPGWIQSSRFVDWQIHGPRNTWPQQNPRNPLNPVAIFWWPGPFDPQR